jgi:dTDP-4-dehydrorhamnose reductase
MRWVITGAGGQLGGELRRALADDNVIALTSEQLDIRDASDVEAVVERDDVVINTAAWTDVDGAEANEPDAYAVNATGPANLAAACATAGATLVHVSTDYVFDGTATSPYAEDTPVAPMSAYGRTKAAGERAVLESTAHAYVVRTGWVYAAGGRNFVATMARLARANDDVRVVDDQVGAPTWASDLADALVALVRLRPEPGIYHATNGGATSWFGFAQAIFAALGADTRRVHAIPSSAMVRPAQRPAYSVLGNARWTSVGLQPLRSWDAAFHAACERDGARLFG